MVNKIIDIDLYLWVVLENIARNPKKKMEQTI